jgi:hypothetical protein
VHVTLSRGFAKAELFILNAAGQRVSPGISTSGSLKTVSLNGQPSGVYLLQVRAGKETRIFTIVKQ